jgi:hypothetical protein
MSGFVAAVVVTLLLAPPALASCRTPRFENKTAFEAYVAGYLHLRSVSCQKLSDRIADCLGSDHRRYVVACEKPHGRDCVIRRY